MEWLENEQIKIAVKAKGAELCSLYDKATDTEFIWQADPAFWGKHSPVLFPIVGALKNNSYQYNGKQYELSRHGFAREEQFEASKENDTLTFTLTESAASLEKYPFRFKLELIYRLKEKKLKVTYRVSNPAQEPLLFSIGAHPAFRLPLDNESEYSDYYLEFSKEETAGRWPISPDGLIEANSIPFLDDRKLPLDKKLFYKDALVFKQLNSNKLLLRSQKNGKGFRFNFEGFPYLGLWAAKDANFVCIEPWCGIADSVNSDQQLQNKEGIVSLGPSEIFEREWSVELF